MINEFLPNPSSGNSEWVEFYNSGPLSIDLSDYYFDDDTSFLSDSGSSPKVALSGLLPSLTTCYLNLSTVLNNNGDIPTLFKTDGSIVDTYQYTQTTVDKSYSRIPDGGDWQTIQTPTKSSTLCADLAPTPTSTPIPPTVTPTPQPTSTPEPTVAPTLTPAPTQIPVTHTPTPNPTPTATPTSETIENNVPGESATAAEKPTPSPASSKPANAQTKEPISLLPFVFIVSGTVLIAGSAVPFVIRKMKVKFKKMS